MHSILQRDFQKPINPTALNKCLNSLGSEKTGHLLQNDKVAKCLNGCRQGPQSQSRRKTDRKGLFQRLSQAYLTYTHINVNSYTEFIMYLNKY